MRMTRRGMVAQVIPRKILPKSITLSGYFIGVGGYTETDEDGTVRIFIASDTNFQAIATILPENVTDKTVVWESSSPQSVSVSDTGFITILRSPRKISVTATTVNGLMAMFLIDRID